MPYVNQGSGLINVNAIVERLVADGSSLAPPQLRRRVVGHLLQIPGCFRADPDHIAYLPRFRSGATVLQPLPQDEPPYEVAPPLIIWLPEVLALWRPSFPKRLPVTVHLKSGPTLNMRWHWDFPEGPIVSRELAEWINTIAEGGHNAMEITCLDGLSNTFSIIPTTLEVQDRTEANQALRTSALEIISHHRRELQPIEIGAELLARGLYHRKPAPLPLLYILFEPPVTVQYHFEWLRAMPRVSAFLRGALENRTREDAFWAGTYWRDSGGMPMPESMPEQPPPAFAGSYRIDLQLDGYSVRRTLELDAESTFEQLQQAIQNAFDWDDDHLWVFSLVGRPGDPTLGVGPEMLDDTWADAADLTLAEAGLELGQEFSYVFDFGARWVVHLKVTALLKGVKTAKPTVVARTGEAPAQYDLGDEDIGWGDE